MPRLLSMLLPMACLLPAHLPCQDLSLPREAWRFTSFAEDADVVGCNVMHMAAETDGGIWLATSDGLRHYDGLQWRRYDRRHGLPSDFVRCVCLTRDGVLWVGTDRGAGTFVDGRFDGAPCAGRLPGPSVRRIVADTDGSLWFCCDRWPRGDAPGGLAHLQQGRWRSFGPGDGLPSDYVSDVAVLGDGRRIAICREGVAEYRDGVFVELWNVPWRDGDGYTWSLVDDDQAGLLVTRGRDTLRLRPDGLERMALERPPEFASGPAKLWRLADGTVITYASSVQRDQFLVLTAAGLVPVSPRLPGNGTMVEHLEESPDGSLWVCGEGMLARWARASTEWSWLPETGTPQFVDLERRVWIDGPQHAGYFQGDDYQAVPGLRGPLVLARDGIYGWSGKALLRWHDGESTAVPMAELGLSEVFACVAGTGGRAWVAGVNSDGEPALRLRHDGSWQAGPPLPPDHSLAHLERVGDGTIACTLRQGDQAVVFLVDATGCRRLLLPERITTLGVPRVHDSGDAIWLLGIQGLRRLGSDQVWQPVGGLPGEHIVAAFRNAAGLWFASDGTTGGRGGLACFDGEAWHRHAVAGTHLLGRSDDGTHFLAGSLDTLCQVPPDSAPFEMRLPARTRVSRVVRGPAGSLWLGTSLGLLRWRQDGRPPATVFRYAPRELAEGTSAVAQVEGHRWFRADSQGGTFQVSHRVDGGDWSPFLPLLDQTIDLGVLDVGDRLIEVRLRDEAGAVDPTPAVWQVRVLPPPLQSRWWFWAAVALGVALLGVAGGLALRSSAVRRELQARLRAEQRHRAVVENSPFGVFEIDLEGRCESVNPAGLRMVGSAAADAVGRPMHEVLGWQQSEQLAECLVAAITGRASEGEFTGRGGLVVFAAFVPLRDALGAVTRVLGIAQDVTERRLLEEQLRHAQKMEAIGQFAGGVAHDFNNLLTAVLGNVDILRARVPADGEHGVGLLKEIETAGLRAAELTRQLLTFARRGPGHVVAQDAGAALRGAEPLLRRLLPETVSLHIDAAGDGQAVLVRLAPGQFEQIVLNLASNAADAMPDGGRLAIAVRPQRLDRDLPTRYGMVATGDHVVVSVRDTGTGIPADIMPRIFEPFFSTKPMGKGTGLGLATVHAIVRRAGGQVEVESAPGSGTEFRIWLPQTDPTAAAVRTTARPPEPPTGGTETVLVCEDQDMVRRLVQRVLQGAGYRVLEAGDGRAAIGVAEAHPSPIHLLITDLVMPEVGGRELARWFARQRPDTRVVFMTGYDHERQGKGDDVLLHKPFTAAELLRLVRRVLDEAAAGG